ncbi:MAG TPA: GNAT family N-acetyltransferase [Bacillota bacterium]|nr:GNAT family N-acetyltransferase [Bacillota bacterium]HPW41204.1 GNAT family N-acetyltransferase [Bacillota bacterium]
MMQIRKIKPEDISFVMELASKYGFSDFKLLSNIEHFLICEDGNTKCGCGCLVPYKGKGYLSCVIVDEGHRRKKLGGAITKALLNIADLQGIEEVYAAGICKDFLQVMGFEKYNGADIKADLINAIGDIAISEYYRVLSKDYFKPCSKK